MLKHKLDKYKFFLVIGISYKTNICPYIATAGAADGQQPVHGAQDGGAGADGRGAHDGQHLAAAHAAHGR